MTGRSRTRSALFPNLMSKTIEQILEESIERHRRWEKDCPFGGSHYSRREVYGATAMVLEELLAAYRKQPAAKESRSGPTYDKAFLLEALRRAQAGESVGDMPGMRERRAKAKKA